MKENKFIKYSLIGISTIFLLLMLVLPLITVILKSLRDGLGVYITAVSDKYTLKALMLTIIAIFVALAVNTIFGLCSAWALTRFNVKGKKLLNTLIELPVTVSPVIAGLSFVLLFGRKSILYPFFSETGISIVYAVGGVLIATVFVTFPFIYREIAPVLEKIGTDEEEAASLMGAKAFTIFTKITFPNIKWSFLYGVVLCSARAIGEFGAVSAISGHLRGLTITLPLQVEILFNEFHYTEAFAVSSILVMIALVILVVKCLIRQLTESKYNQ